MLDWLLKPKRVQPAAGNEPTTIPAPPGAGAVQVPSAGAAPAPEPEPKREPTPQYLATVCLIQAAMAVDERCSSKNLNKLHRALKDFQRVVVNGAPA